MPSGPRRTDHCFQRSSGGHDIVMIKHRRGRDDSNGTLRRRLDDPHGRESTIISSDGGVASSELQGRDADLLTEAHTKLAVERRPRSERREHGGLLTRHIDAVFV